MTAQTREEKSARQRAYKAERYADPIMREVLKERAREYGRLNRERRRVYMREYGARKAKDPKFVMQERERSRESNARRRAAINADPEKRKLHLQRRQDQRAGAVREREIEKYLVDRVIALGGFCPKFVDPGRRGAPDRIVMVPGHPSIYVELKRPIGGEVSVSQERFHAKIRAAGQLVWVVRTKAAADALLTDLSLL